MEVIITGRPKEIAALVVGLQERQSFSTDNGSIKDIAQAICDKQQGAQGKFGSLR